MKLEKQKGVSSNDKNILFIGGGSYVNVVSGDCC